MLDLDHIANAEPPFPAPVPDPLRVVRPPENSAFPLNVVTPATLTLSKFVWPSTSKSPFKSEAPLTSRVSVSVLPTISIPVLVVLNLGIVLLVPWNSWTGPALPGNRFISSIKPVLEEPIEITSFTLPIKFLIYPLWSSLV